MKKFTFTLLSLFAYSQTVFGGDAVLESIRAKEQDLNQFGISGFYRKANVEKWSAPLIRSNWATMRVADLEERNRQNASNEFGKKVLDALPGFLNNMPDSISGKLDKAKEIIKFSEWIATQNGYGNALIARRAIDLALPILGGIMVDKSTSVEIMSTIDDLLKVKWARDAFVADVLNQEIEQNLFDRNQNQEYLQGLWKEGARRYLVNKNPDLSKSLPSNVLVNPQFASFDIKSNVLPFFCDEPLPSIPTSSKLISGKHHEQIVFILLPPNLQKLKDLLTFRICLGGFPDEGIKNDFYPGLKGAFDETWRRYYISGKAPKGLSLKLGLAAWSTYEAVIQNRITPEDETLLKKQ